MQLFKGYKAAMVNHLFQMLLVSYLILLLIEQVWQGFVSTYFNLNYLLIIVIFAGILDVFSEHEIKVEKVKKTDYFFIIVLGILGTGIIFYKTKSLGWLSYLISLIAGILIILLSLLVLTEDKEEIKKPAKFKKRAWIIGIIALFTILALILPLFTPLNFLASFRIVFGSIFVLFLPGFIISYLFFPEKRTIDSIERIALSFALSIAIVPLAVFYLNLIGLKINLLNSFLTILGIIAISSIILIIRNKKLLFTYRRKNAFKSL